ncbi:hypothetical protein K3495_g16318, partial [Podosphaera aphanis]
MANDVPMNNPMMPNHPAWQQILDSWDKIISDSTPVRFALPRNIPTVIRHCLNQAHSAGKSSLGDATVIDYSDLYPVEVTDLQSRLIDDAVCLGQGLGLAATKRGPSCQDTSTTRGRAPNIPDTFDGTRAKFGNYATQMQLQFRSDPAAFPSEESKIIYAGSFLTENAYTWFYPYIDKYTGKVDFPSYSAFIAALGAAFDDPDSYATATRQLDSLHQDSSCAAYYARAVSVFSLLGWTEEPVLIYHFRKGLKENLKDA